MIVLGSIPGENDAKITQNPVRRTLSGEEQVWKKEGTRGGNPIWIRIEPSRTSLYGGLILQALFLELNFAALRDTEKTFFFVALDCFHAYHHPCSSWIGSLLLTLTLLRSRLSAATAQPTRPPWGGWYREREKEQERERNT